MQTLPCPTAYLEGCFIDNKADFAHIDTSEKRRELGESYARGILSFLGLAYLPPASGTGEVLQYVNDTSRHEVKVVLQYVNASSTAESENVLQNVNDVSRHESKTILQSVKASSAAETENILQSVNSTKTVCRVIAGSYSSRENAEKHALELKNLGIETFLAAYQL
jgi:hypothetical protein